MFMKGNGTWDKRAMKRCIDAFKSVYAFIDKQGLKRGRPVDDDLHLGRRHRLQLPGRGADRRGAEGSAAGDIAIGKSPGGRRSSSSIAAPTIRWTATYEAITNHLDEKRLEAQDLFIEEYETDPVTTPEDKFVVTVYVPVR